MRASAKGSGSTNVLTGSGVDEAWSTGVMLAEGVLKLLASRTSLSQSTTWMRAYVKPAAGNRRLEAEAKIG